MDLPSVDSPRRTPGGSRRRVVTRLGLMVLIAGVFLAGILTGDVVGPGTTGASNSISDQPGFDTLQQVWDLIHEKFADPNAVDDESLMYGAAGGMVASLGDTGHSTFLDPEEATAFRASLSGELVGLGISIEYQDGEPVIVAPIKDSPAEKAGLLPGDVIVEIDGVPTLAIQGGDHFAAAVGDTLVLADSDDSLAASIRALGGKTATLAGAAKLPLSTRQGVFVFVTLGDDLLGAMQGAVQSKLLQLGLRSLVLDVGEAGGMITASARADLRTAEAVAKARSILEGLRAMASLADEPEVRMLVDGLTLTTTGQTLEVNAKIPVAEVAKAVQQHHGGGGGAHHHHHHAP